MLSDHRELLVMSEIESVAAHSIKKIQFFTCELSDDDEVDDHGDEARNVEDDDDNDNHEANNGTRNVGINMIPNVL